MPENQSLLKNPRNHSNTHAESLLPHTRVVTRVRLSLSFSLFFSAEREERERERELWARVERARNTGLPRAYMYRWTINVCWRASASANLGVNLVCFVR